MRRLLVGVIGHVDHGKTALVHALTGIDTDRLPEEKRRGISIALGFAHLRVADTVIDFVDMPGHERFVRTMVAGATGIDAVLLVIDAREGAKPQTKEHVAIASLLGISEAVLAISKCDLVSQTEAAEVARSGAALLARAGLDVAPPILTSARRGEGIEALRATLGEIAARVEPRAERGFAWLPIDRAFSLAGHGSIVTGTLRCGRVSATEPLELVPEAVPVRVRGMQVHKQSVPAALPGQRVAVNLRGVEAGALRRGQALATPGLLRPAAWIGVGLRSLPNAPPLRGGAVVSLLAGSLECEARLRLLDREVLEPGAECVAQLHCRPAVALPGREAFVLRGTSPQATLGGGRVLDPAMVRLRRGQSARLERLALATPEQAVRDEVEAAGMAGCDLASLARVAGLAPARVRAALADAPVRVLGEIAIGAASADRLAAAIQRAVGSAPGGLSREAIQRALSRRLRPALVDAALAALAEAGSVHQRGGTYRARDEHRDRLRTLEEADLAQRIAGALLQARLSPPDAKTLLAAHRGSRAALERLTRDGVLIRTLDRVQKREILFHRDAIEHARTTLTPHLAQPPGLLLGEAGAILGITRKYAVPLMEYFDAVQFTRRIGERRVLARQSAADRAAS